MGLMGTKCRLSQTIRRDLAAAKTSTPGGWPHLRIGNLLSEAFPGTFCIVANDSLEIVLRNVKQLQLMINDLLEATRLQGDKLRIDLQSASVPAAIAYTINTLQGAATAKRITLSSCNECRLPPVCADPTRIRQALIILVDNAIKFTPANGTVKVQARILEGDSKFLLLEVSDSGCGISPDVAERIFERLFQVSDPGLPSRKGLGLGLYICKDLVTRHGGQIWAKSVPGHGTVFSLTLPIFS